MQYIDVSCLLYKINMDTDIFYEKIVDITKSQETNFLIQVSESRRQLRSSLKQQYLVYENAKNYVHDLLTLISTIKQSSGTLHEPPLFQWQGCNSSNWYFEVNHVYEVLFAAAMKKGKNIKDNKEANQYFKEAVQVANKAALTAQKIKWKDVSNVTNFLLNDRYWLGQAFSAAGYYYNSMYEYAIQQEKGDGVGASASIKMASECSEIASKLWKSVGEATFEVETRAKFLFNIARKLDDNQCGERIALLKDVYEKQTKHIPNNIREQYVKWTEQNNSVYFQEVATNITLIPSDLATLIPKILALSE